MAHTLSETPCEPGSLACLLGRHSCSIGVYDTRTVPTVVGRILAYRGKLVRKVRIENRLENEYEEVVDWFIQAFVTTLTLLHIVIVAVLPLRGHPSMPTAMRRSSCICRIMLARQFQLHDAVVAVPLSRNHSLMPPVVYRRPLLLVC